MKKIKEHKFTLKDVENFTNSVLLPRLRKQARTNKAISDRVNIILFLYSVGRMSAIESVIRLSLIDLVGTDDFKELKDYFKEE